MIPRIPPLIRAMHVSADPRVFENDDTLFTWPWVDEGGCPGVARVRRDGLLQCSFAWMTRVVDTPWVSPACYVRLCDEIPAWEGVSMFIDVMAACDRLSHSRLTEEEG